MNLVNSNESREDYLERILMLEEEGKTSVRAVDLVNSLGYAAASVSVALKKLESRGLVYIDEANCLHLTPEGREIASKIYERHEVIGGLLTMLGVEEDTAYRDACRMEHDISDETFLAIKKLYESEKSKRSSK
jgi:Mn-dependent DtxR family transcriptional regulator